jgi:uncharacterized protein DUF1579
MVETAMQTQWVPTDVKPGPEMEALAPFFYDCTWTGTVYANMQGPGSPEMKATGGARCTPLMDGLWLATDNYQDQFVGDTKILTWKLFMLVGWDVVAQEYRAVLVDSNGVATMMRGELNGPIFVMTPAEPVRAAGQMASVRFTWDATDPKAVKWCTEASVNGGPWMLVEDYVMVPVE